jgi:predicted enzyme related to lactoylglutathione lyase
MMMLNWFEIPAENLDRAVAFYEKVLQTELRREDFGGIPNAIFTTREGADGAVILDPRRKPSANGALVYLGVTGRLDAVLARVGEAGGRVVLPKTDIGDPGFIALVQDSEGNVVGLHSERAAARG